MQIFKIIKDLAETRDHHGALVQSKGEETLRGNGKPIMREDVILGLRSKSFALLVANGWN